MSASIDTSAEVAPGRVGMVAVLVCTLFPMLGLFAIGPALPAMTAAFSTTPDAVMMVQLMGGVAGLSFAISAPGMGWLVERLGYRRVYIVSLCALAVLGALPAFLQDLKVILATRLLLGVAVAGAATAGMTGLSTLPVAIRPRMFGWSAIISSVGTLITFPAVGALSTLGWRWPFAVYLLPLLVVPMAMTLPIVRPTADDAPAAGARSGGGIGVPLPILAITGFVGLTMYVGPMFIPFYMKHIGVTDPTLATLPISGMSAAALLITTLYTSLHKRLGVTGLFCLMFAFTGLGFIAAGFSFGLLTLMAAMFVVSCGMSLFMPNLNAYVASTSPSPARGMGWAMASLFGVQVAFPFLARVLSDQFGPAGVFRIFGAIALVVAAGFALVLSMNGKAKRAQAVQG